MVGFKESFLNMISKVPVPLSSCWTVPLNVPSVIFTCERRHSGVLTMAQEVEEAVLDIQHVGMVGVEHPITDIGTLYNVQCTLRRLYLHPACGHGWGGAPYHRHRYS